MVLTLLKLSRDAIHPVFDADEMRFCWKVNMQEYLDEKGFQDPCMSRSSSIMAGYFGRIVWVATRDATFGPVFSDIFCRRRPHRYPCRGRLEIIYVDYLSNGQIYWRCPSCSDKGIITGWEGSCWDMMARQPRLEMHGADQEP
ncbi:hypothetical protein [Desulfonatronospira sp.]|uniref:hypothetical protein n=1 Tax=Desulfonatronospira sp. TaxID=1962951 RepID=UPI0025BA973A|nr:hypothetical protein [Desulfonatronospira sp.]